MEIAECFLLKALRSLGFASTREVVISIYVPTLAFVLLTAIINIGGHVVFQGFILILKPVYLYLHRLSLISTWLYSPHLSFYSTFLKLVY